MDETLIDALQADLEASGYSAGAVESLLGAAADAARQRGVFTPARRALAEREGSALATLVRLFLLGEDAAAAEIDAALPGLGTVGAVRLGLVEDDPCSGAGGEAYRAALSLNPVEVATGGADAPLAWWVLSDLDDQLRRGPARPDHVMGVGGATRSLIAQAPFGLGNDSAHDRTALDLGTGCGVVAMHLAEAFARAAHVADGGGAAPRHRVVATDVSERALILARANARLNGLADRIEFRLGDLFAPVAGERFDLILSNPPFVITPRTDDAPVYAYRDGGRAGDDLIAEVVRTAPSHLEAGGTLFCLANWETPWGGNGLERVRSWIDEAADRAGALDAWTIERDRVDPAQYAETWARDGGARPGSPEFERLMDAWLADFARRRVVSIGLGSVRVRRAESERGRTVVHADHAAGAFAAVRVGAGLAAAFDAGIAAARMSDAEVLATHWVLDDAVVEEREHHPGEEAPRAIVLRTDRPIARRVTADTLLAAAVGACDGELSLRQIADALATILEVDAGAAADALVAGARELAWLGMLTPPVGRLNG